MYSRKLDDAIPADHIVRFVDQVLDEVDWTKWEATYHLSVGQPAIHPRVLAGLLVYGVMHRIRSSYALEEQLELRNDFRWLASGWQIDNSTICKFRREHKAELKDLFMQIVHLAREEQHLEFQQVGFDGTRVQANNRRSRSRTPEQLATELAELQKQAEELFAQAEAEDAAGSPPIPSKLTGDATCRKERIQAALAEVAKLKEANATLPKRIPLTDPEARVMPNKAGGSGVNYTPTVTVDLESGLILEADVLNVINEDQHLIPSVKAVQEDYQLPKLPNAAADGLMATGANLAACEQLGIILYSPVPLPDPDNPALRSDPTQPVAEGDRDRLPVNKIRSNGQTRTQLDKSAFVFDPEANCYRCPMGEELPYRNTTSEASATGRRVRDRYQADPKVCAGCPLRDKCLSGKAQSRSISREQFEPQRERQAQRMATPEAKEIYKDRSHKVETAFAVVKQRFGLRQFLTRGLERVQQEWRWACLAFNVRRLASRWMARVTGPPPTPVIVQ
jgi:transposase